MVKITRIFEKKMTKKTVVKKYEAEKYQIFGDF